MSRLIAIISVLVIGCGNPPTNNSLKQQIVDRDTLLSDTFSRKEVTVNSAATKADTVYNNNILFYKDSIDNNSALFKKVNKSIEGASEGGEAILYLSGKDTLKMDITFYGETGKSTYVFYLKNGYPVFYVGTTTLYNEPINISKDTKTDSITIDKIILRNKTIVNWLQNGDKVKDKCEEKEQEISDLYNEIRALIKQ